MARSDPATVVAVLTGDQRWQPSWQQVWFETGLYFDGETGAEVLPDHPHAHPWMEMRPAQPRLWQGLAKLYGDAKAQRVVSS
ncbi:hypothetical protein AB0H36_32715 [Kribbella sp. NPDC050820]|uniref:hypothetical protein n=1 Tax=Kribbella sp. NPDC050820 TaxID=3155408 RepID=UPI0034076113